MPCCCRPSDSAAVACADNDDGQCDGCWWGSGDGAAVASGDTADDGQRDSPCRCKRDGAAVACGGDALGRSLCDNPSCCCRADACDDNASSGQCDTPSGCCCQGDGAAMACGDFSRCELVGGDSEAVACGGFGQCGHWSARAAEAAPRAHAEAVPLVD